MKFKKLKLSLSPPDNSNSLSSSTISLPKFSLSDGASNSDPQTSTVISHKTTLPTSTNAVNIDLPPPQCSFAESKAEGIISPTPILPTNCTSVPKSQNSYSLVDLSLFRCQLTSLRQELCFLKIDFRKEISQLSEEIRAFKDQIVDLTPFKDMIQSLSPLIEKLNLSATTSSNSHIEPPDAILLSSLEKIENRMNMIETTNAKLFSDVDKKLSDVLLDNLSGKLSSLCIDERSPCPCP